MEYLLRTCTGKFPILYVIDNVTDKLYRRKEPTRDDDFTFARHSFLSSSQ
jgi:hypothetical protein